HNRPRERPYRARRRRPDAGRPAHALRAQPPGTDMKGKQVVLGVSGSIAAYKVIEVARDLTRAGARVDTILTRAAQQFVTPLTFQSLTYRDVYTDLWAPNSTEGEEHIRLARRADLVAILPTTADLLARLAHGLADDLLTTVVLATRAPVLLAPAMDG